jgi:glycosyltransferase involved in cell wall biosynthesis
MTKLDHVCICLATYNGARFIEKQLKSFVDQTHQNWSLLISDDGSTDETKNIIYQFIEDYPKKHILLIDGPGQGYLKNFLSLLCHNQAIGDYFAFADQDDIWLPKKLEVSLYHLSQLSGNGPKLYGSRTKIIDTHDNQLTLSPLFQKKPSFVNALVQNFSGGNTMLFNKEAKISLECIGADIDVVSHDWWVYLVVSGLGGKIIYDPNPQVLYRSHSLNIIGVNQGTVARIKRLYAAMEGKYAGWNDLNVTALYKFSNYLTPENRKLLAEFSQFRSSWGINALVLGHKMGLYRLTRCGTLSLYLAGFFGKV